MTNIIYHSLIISCISDLEKFPIQLKEWIISTINENDRGFFIIYCLVSSLARFKSEVSEDAIEYFRELLADFCGDEEVNFLSMFAYSYLFSLHANTQASFDAIEQAVANWEKTVSMPVKSDEYSNMDFIKDLAKINYLRACYPVVSNHTKKVREVAIELLETKEKFETFETKFKAFLQF